MKRPLIGINPHYFYYRDSFWNATKEMYYQAVWLGGGLPVTLHYPSNDGNAKEMVEVIDGLLIVGGPDLPGGIYEGEQPDLLDQDVMHPRREAFDRSIFLATRKAGKPVLSICAGFQHINVLYGGTLYEDLETQKPGSVNHGEFNGQWSEHSVELTSNSLISKVMGITRLLVISTHHQGIRELGNGLKPVAHADDGLIEALEDVENPEAFLAVQWHPEIGIQRPEQLRLFKWLVHEAIYRRKDW